MTLTDDTPATLDTPQEFDAALRQMEREWASHRRAIARIERHYAEDAEEFRQELARLTGQMEADTKAGRARMAALEEMAKAWMLEHRDHPALHGAKSVKGSHWVISSTARPVAFDKDDTALRRWATEHGYLRTRVVEEIDWQRIKDECAVRGNRFVLQAGDLRGECVDGVTVVEQDPSVTVKPR